MIDLTDVRHRYVSHNFLEHSTKDKEEKQVSKQFGNTFGVMSHLNCVESDDPDGEILQLNEIPRVVAEPNRRGHTSLTCLSETEKVKLNE